MSLGDVRMSWKLPSSAGTRLLCLPGRRSPYLTRQSSWKPHRHLGCPLLPSGCGVCRAARVQSPPLPGGGDPSSRSSSSLPLQPPPPPRAPSTDPPSCPLDSIPGPVLPPGPWGARTVHLGVPPCSPSGLISFWPASQTLRVPHPVSLFPSNCQPAPPRPHPGRSRSAKTLGLHVPEAEVFIPCAATRIRKASSSAPTLSS